MALCCGLEYPKTIGGIICLSGFLSPHVVTSQANLNLSIYYSHGMNDERIPIEVGY